MKINILSSIYPEINLPAEPVMKIINNLSRPKVPGPPPLESNGRPLSTGGHCFTQLDIETDISSPYSLKKTSVYCPLSANLPRPIFPHTLGTVHLISWGGGLEFFSGPRNFFRTILEQDYFFRRPFGPDYFFFKPKAIIYMYRLSRQLMLNSGFRDNYMLISGFRDNFMLNWGFCNTFTFMIQSRFSQQLHTVAGTTRKLHIVNLTLPLSRFSSQLHTKIDLTSLYMWTSLTYNLEPF